MEMRRLGAWWERKTSTRTLGFEMWPELASPGEVHFDRKLTTARDAVHEPPVRVTSKAA